MNPIELLRWYYPARFPDKQPFRLNNRKFLRIFVIDLAPQRCRKEGDPNVRYGFVASEFLPGQ
jgi:hypothetical protein